jgi:hypothetical protein
VASIVALANVRSTNKERRAEQQRRETSALLAVHAAVRGLREVVHQGGVGRSEHRGARDQLLDALRQAPRSLPASWELHSCQGRPPMEKFDAALGELDGELGTSTPIRSAG